MNALNITKHSIDRTALIAGIMFTFAGLAYLVDDHGIVNVTEGAVAGTIVIVIGLVLLLAAVIDSPEIPLADDFTSSTTGQADFSWNNPVGSAPTDTQTGFSGFDKPTSAGNTTETSVVDAAENLVDPTDEISEIDEAE